MTTMRHDPERGWVPAEPLGYIGDGPDFEVYRAGTGWRWCAYGRDVLLAKGTARTRIGLQFGLWRANRRLRRQIARAAR